MRLLDKTDFIFNRFRFYMVINCYQNQIGSEYVKTLKLQMSCLNERFNFLPIFKFSRGTQFEFTKYLRITTTVLRSRTNICWVFRVSVCMNRKYSFTYSVRRI